MYINVMFDYSRKFGTHKVMVAGGTTGLNNILDQN